MYRLEITIRIADHAVRCGDLRYICPYMGVQPITIRGLVTSEVTMLDTGSVSVIGNFSLDIDARGRITSEMMLLM